MGALNYHHESENKIRLSDILVIKLVNLLLVLRSLPTVDETDLSGFSDDLLDVIHNAFKGDDKKYF